RLPENTTNLSADTDALAPPWRLQNRWPDHRRVLTRREKLLTFRTSRCCAPLGRGGSRAVSANQVLLEHAGLLFRDHDFRFLVSHFRNAEGSRSLPVFRTYALTCRVR